MGYKGSPAMGWLLAAWSVLHRNSTEASMRRRSVSMQRVDGGVGF
jgi:hypothetical protein